MHQQLLELSRIVRVRIRSWKDVVLIIVASVLYGVGEYLMQRFIPEMSDKTRRLLLTIGMVILIVIGLFIIGD